MERGFLFTSAKMISNPGQTVTQFIIGKRKNYQTPVSYFLIWTTVYILFLYLIEKVFGQNAVINYSEYFGSGYTTRFAISHLSLVLVMVIPFQALFLYLFVGRVSFNYCESLVSAFYSMGTIIIFQFVFAVISIFVHILFHISVDLRISDFLKIFYISWFVLDLVKIFPVKRKMARAFLFILFAFGTFTAWRMVGFPLVANWIFDGISIRQ
jgi:hypothetical protein